MGNIRSFAKEKLVVGVLLGPRAGADACLERLDRLFGPRDFTSPPIAFTFTSYYDEELGTPITRLFAAFARLVAPSELAAIKLATNALEDELAEGGRRRFNLDPGILSLSRLVLASTKPSSHRVPLERGIYAEIELMFEHGSFRPVEWTYADYRSPGYLALFASIRDVYKANVKAAGVDPAL